ncbi:MAG: hypothetical protein U5P41_04450 [Gammaproteobacteria bacterium]|nr:hypothetical protein [Gammaproteobacteria bacterium]
MRMRTHSIPRRQQGFSAVIAIVLIVVLALLGAYAATTVGVQSLSTTLSSGGMQTWFAARAGVDRAVHSVLSGAGCGGVPGTPITLSGGGLDNVTITQLACSSSTVQEGPDNYDVYQITATATRGGSPGNAGYVSRTIQVSVTDAD